MTVNPAVTPSVSTVVSPIGTICAGISVTFTATPTNGGSTPTYQWKKGGVNISGETNATYTTTTAANGDSYTVTMTSNATCASPATATSSAIVMTVTSTVTPSVSIIASPSGAICAGASVTFTATPTNGGTTPTYQWKKGGINIAGATNSTYTTTTAANGDSYTVTITSNASCASPLTATSNAIVMTVNPILTPSVSASANNSTICTGTSITFTATPTNGGPTPGYKWKLGSSYIAGATNATYVTTTAADNDSYSVEMTSNAACASTTPVVSNSVVITITASPTPSVVITATPGNSICTGTSTTFTTAVSNGGTPTYKWKKGASYISGATNDTYTSSSIANGDVYSVEIVSSLSCVTTPNATSNSITMTVNTPVTPSVSITSTGSTICAGASVSFTATPVNGGTPTYKWKLGSSYITGATNATYTTTSAANGDSYSVEMTSSAVCATPAIVTSSPIVMTVNPNLTTSVSITANNTSVCAGTNIIFTATPTNGGTTPAYKWKLGSSYITGATNVTFSTTTASNNDSYSVELTSNAACATPVTATSNPVVVTVNTGVTPTITATASATTICDGTSITFTSTQTGGGTPTYKWKLGSSYIAGETNSTYTTTTANNGDVYSVEMSSTASCASPGTVTSAGITITVNPTVVPFASITVSNTTICAGSSITFTAAPVNGGTPTYKWKLGSSYITGATGSTYTTTTAADGDAYSVEMVSNAACASPTTVTSNAIVIDVNPILIPSVSISANNSSTCSGSAIVFTATPTNGGSAPNYKWKLGSAYIAGATNSTYTTTTAMDGDSYSVEMISNATCATTAVKTSNSIVITITTSPSASVVISANPGTTICAGTLLKFTATPGNGGTAPTYQWNLNGSPVAGETNSTYSSSAFANGDKVSVSMVSNSSCVSDPNASSAETTIVVNPVLTPSVSIVASATTICAGESVTFTATPVNGGTPTYQWKAGSSNLSGATEATFTSSGFVNGNTISVEMTSTALCGLPSTVASNPVTMVVNPVVVPTVHITSSATAICPGGTVTLTASQTGGGTPTYKWKLNNNYISGATTSAYSTTTAVNNDSYTVEMTSSATCATPATLESNPVVITVNTQTVITQQPVDQSVCTLGNTVTFSVTATGANLTYQWKKGSTNLSNNSIFSGTQTKNLTITNVSASELALDYSVTVTGSCGVAVSNAVALSQSTTPISIVTQPTAQTVVTGGTISLTVAATGPSLTYQWKRNGIAIANDSRISGTNTSNLIITNAQVSDNYNDYVCILSSPCATTVNSTAVQVTVSSATSVSVGQAQGFNVYPNPNAGTFSLTNDYAPFEVEQIEIVSLEGVVVLTKSVSGRVELNEEILATELASGMYLLIIKGEGHQALVKIAIDK
ncbi:MAG: immunoglobulin domain-containing protein [Cytophaga sp.]|uniref:immunoglobulin domain-containing protein n=1 Tax=Cytophaga sp. TaxID=29535 RepID=UPI003F7FBA4F